MADYGAVWMPADAVGMLQAEIEAIESQGSIGSGDRDIVREMRTLIRAANGDRG
ncbi:hypothetical protein JOF42_000344 [Microbacterium phyllosphaerae]|uniref:Uncharacterized protein n=1 Tax=Microbacterium phyllosphaerae TaxID=124798 RepID=A0ABS4WKW4_9MICO|nr:hypothetical protein [Microbacterium phyllosphaerae]